MTDTVFWSWQSDLPESSNRAFIRDVLVITVRRVSETLDVEDVELVALDHDTKATAGMADISQTILEKIARSAVMAADVTPIELAAAGMGVAYTPRFAIADMLNAGRLVPLLEDFEMDSGPVSAVYLEGRVLPRKIRALIDFAVEDIRAARIT